MATACAQEGTSRRGEIQEWYRRSSTHADHEILGVPADCGPAALKAAFAQLARRFHPDTVAPCDDDLRQQVQAIFMRISEAYHALGGGATRARAPLERGARDERRTGACAGRPVPREAPASVSPTPARDGSVTAREQPPAVEPQPADHGPHWRHARVEEALARAQERMAQNQAESAIATLHDVVGLADAEQRHQIRLSLARAYVGERRWLRYGLAMLDEAVRERPRDAEALELLGGVYLREGLLARAEEALARALAAEPARPGARSQLRAVRAARLKRRAGAGARPGSRGLVGRFLEIVR